MRERLRDRLEISPQRYAQVTAVALGALALIVLTGAGVRLTGSGLGCPDWPKCYGGATPPLESHAVIEYTNRLLTGPFESEAAASDYLGKLRKAEVDGAFMWTSPAGQVVDDLSVGK